MTIIPENLKDIAKAIKLDSERKKKFGLSLRRFMEASEAVRVRQGIRQISQSNSLLTFFSYPMSIFLILALVLGAGGGTSFAAEQALPGDLLYTVKVDINEKVAAVFSFNAEAKAQLEARLAERRLEEASKLALENKLDANAQSELSARFTAHSQATKSKIKNLESSGDIRGAANVSSEFEASLRAHQAILARLNATTSDDARELSDDLSDAISSTTQLRVDLEDKISVGENSPEVKTAAEGRLGAAVNIIASARNYLQNKKSQLSASSTAQAEGELTVADQLVVDGQAKVQAGAYGDAFNLANAAIRKAQGVRVIIQAQDNLNLEIRFRGGDNQNEVRNNGSASSSIDVGNRGENEKRNATSSNSDDSKKSGAEIKVEGGGKSDLDVDEGGGVNASGSIKIKLGL